MKNIPCYELVADEYVSVTAARRFVSKHQISAPALLLVRSSAWTVDRFYWSDKGMFGALYAERNYFNFSCLRELRLQLLKDGTIYPENNSFLLGPNVKPKSRNHEFAFL